MLHLYSPSALSFPSSSQNTFPFASLAKKTTTTATPTLAPPCLLLPPVKMYTSYFDTVGKTKAHIAQAVLIILIFVLAIVRLVLPDSSPGRSNVMAVTFVSILTTFADSLLSC